MSFRVKCPVCGKNETIKLFEKQGSTFVQCKEDRLVYINPQPAREELQATYDTYGREFFVPRQSIAGSGDYPEYRRRFLDFRQTNRLLEIGAAAGRFLVCCRKDGWETYGVELSLPSSQFAREHHGLNVFTGTLHDAKYERGFFDVVVAWQTLEHVPNPREVVMEVFHILRLGGFFVLSVPCWNGLSIRLLKQKYRYVGRDHLFYFSSENMVRMLADVGFCKVHTRTGGFNPIVWYQDAQRQLVCLSENWVKNNQKMESMVGRWRTDPFVKVIHQFYYKIIEGLNLGDTLFAEAVKE